MTKEDIKYNRNVIIKNEDIKNYLEKIKETVESAKENIKSFEEKNQQFELDLGRYKEKITPFVKEEDEKIEKSDYEVLADVKLIDGEVTMIYEDVIERRKFTFLEQKEQQLNTKLEKAKEEENK